MLQLDIAIFYAINHLPHPAFLNLFSQIVHYATLGGLIYYPFFIFLFLLKDYKKLAVLAAGSSLVTYIVTDLILKNFFDRVRPFKALVDVNYVPNSPGSFSFPSGQTGTAFAVAMIFVLLFPRKIQTYLVLAFAFLVALDRIYMGHHYPSDVLAGALIGALVSLLINAFVKNSRLSATAA
ncbi:MAG: phosphatase PAP2 family protein [Acidobacteriaceae bacterium]